jgi:hypothetical protein
MGGEIFLARYIYCALERVTDAQVPLFVLPLYATQSYSLFPPFDASSASPVCP